MSDQEDVIAFLADGQAYGSGSAVVTQVETHAAIVFLVGDRAYKLKKAVSLPYLDFSTLDLRRQVCEEEIRLNRRTAPDVYLGVRPVTRGDDGRLALDGDGRAVEWLVEMRRFDDNQLLDRLARSGELHDHALIDLADEVAAFHAAAAPCPAGADVSEYLRVNTVIAGEFDAYTPEVFAAEPARRFVEAVAAEGERHRALLARRRADGRVCECHGDLHLRNIFLEHGRPVIFDAIEFDARLSHTDVMYDLAFLLMDLWHRDMRHGANVVLNRYLARTGDIEGLAVLPMFLALRAGIRAHVNATMAAGTADADKAAARRQEARDYLALALDCLTPRPPRLIGIGGLSGSGKSTLAAALAPELGPPPGAVRLRSDEIRKVLMGVEPEQPLPPSAYASEVSDRVYGLLYQRSATALAAGCAVIADATHSLADGRRRLAEVAREAGVRFDGLWLEAPTALMARRIDDRTRDPSDATVEVLHAQLREETGAIDWQRIDSSGEIAGVLAAARRCLEVDQT